MVTRQDGEERPTVRSTARKIVVVGPVGRAHEPILDTTEETSVEEDGLVEITTVTLGRCQACGRTIHGESELGGACLCGGVLCLECSKRRCVRCGLCVCLTCSVEISGSVYCRRDGLLELAGRVLTIFILISIVCSIAAAVWHFAL